MDLERIMRRHLDALIGLLLGLGAGVVWLFTMGHSPYPGRSAYLIAQSLGLSPKLDPSSPLWHWIAGVIGRLPFGSSSVLLNLFSVICSIVSIWLFYEVIRRSIALAIDVYDFNRRHAEVAPRIAGIVACIALAFSIPFWIVSTRAHVASFDIMLLMLIARLTVAFAESGRIRTAALLAFIYGAGAVEFATLIVFAPIAAFFVLFFLWRREEASVGSILKIAVAGLAGLVFYLIAAWDFYGSHGYEMRMYDSFFRILWIMWRDQYFLITRSMPKFGWLVIILMSGVPWGTVLLVGKRGLNQEKDWGFYALHLMISVLVVAAVLNLKVSPWNFVKGHRLLVTPYVLVAATAGYLVAYWFMLPLSRWRDAAVGLKQAVRNYAGPALAVCWFALVIAASFLNAGRSSSRNAGFVSRYAESVIDNLDGRSWLVTGGLPDNNLLIAAHERGKDVKILNLGRGQNDVYMRHVASMFEDVELKNMAGIGMFQLLSTWMASDPDIEEKLALMVLPDLWFSAGYTAIPYKMIFFGGRQEEFEVQMAMQEQRKFMGNVVQELSEANAGELEWMQNRILRHVSMVANNLGVLMQDAGHEDFAHECYSMAREANEDNISAILNLGSMVRSGYKAPDTEGIEKELEETIARVRGLRNIWALSRYHGYVRSPQAYANVGLAWAYSGRPGLAVTGLRRAMEMVPDSAARGIKGILADVYLSHEMEDKSRILYEELLKDDPGNHKALVGMSRIAAAEGKTGEALQFMQRARQAGAPKAVVGLELGRLFLAGNQVDKARIVLEELVDLRPEMLKAWALLAQVLLMQDDEKALRECIEQIQAIPGGNPIIFTIRSQQAAKKGDMMLALSHLRDAAQADPGNVRLARQLMKLEMLQNNLSEAGDAARLILRKDPSDALANYVLGKVQIRNGDVELAKDSLRKSLKEKRAARTLNDLAWLLQHDGEYQEAEELAREAIELRPKLGQAWDTLGVILMRTDRLEEAQTALENAISFSADKTSVKLSMAELQARLGNRKSALELVEEVREAMRSGESVDISRLKRVRRMAR